MIIAGAGGSSGDLSDYYYGLNPPNSCKSGLVNGTDAADYNFLVEEGAGKTNQYSDQKTAAASGGAGFRSDTPDGWTKSFLNDGGIGSSSFHPNSGFSHGGFGCGGSSHDGGGGPGGWKGGDSGKSFCGSQGAYSFASGRKVSFGFNAGDGIIEIIQRFDSNNVNRYSCDYIMPWIFQGEAIFLIYIIL